MVDILVPIAATTMMVLFVDQVRRLISHAILNGTIRRAMEKHPASTPLLIAKLEQRRPWSEGLVGWIFVAFGVALGLGSLFEDTEARAAGLQVAGVTLTVGIAVLLYVRRLARNTPHT
jgi:hypothetical protein